MTGTYVRTSAIDTLVQQFLASQPDREKQIISLGAGSDTRYFRLLTKDPSLRECLIYHEVDFSTNIEQKLAVISKSPELQAMCSPLKPGKQTYFLHSLDLRDLDESDAIPSNLKTVDTRLPTVILSECCLVYLEPSLADIAAKYFSQFLFKNETPLGMILYEPIKPSDPFGKVMVANLAARGIELQTLRKYGSLEAQAARMKTYGFEDSLGMTINDWWNSCVSEADKSRIATLEMVDEVEEWELLAGHYCIVWSWRNNTDGIWNPWKADETRSF